MTEKLQKAVMAYNSHKIWCCSLGDLHPTEIDNFESGLKEVLAFMLGEMEHLTQNIVLEPRLKDILNGKDVEL